MVLSDNDIWEAIAQQELTISPPEGFELLVKPSSVDLRLDSTIQVMRSDLVGTAEIVDPT